MLDIKKDTTERAILVALKTGRMTDDQLAEHLDELMMLTETAGAETIMRVTQEKQKIDPAFYIGKGKAEEIAELSDLNDCGLIIIDDDLTATQVRNLEKLIDKKILDRSGLILDIFASHAQTNEAKTQVELAQLQYMLPRLTRAWTHLSKQYGGIGTKGPGETQIETDRRIIRTRISKLKEKLGKIDSQQNTKSMQRKSFFTASLVGYTNAGKSTLLNLLTGADVLAENKLFATLDSTTRSLDLDKNRKILMSDTVGFIRKLPHNLVASFRSTLKVAADADLIIHVIDVSHDFFEDHIKVVEETLKEIGCEGKKEIKVFNKVDKLEDRSRISYISSKYPGSVVISAGRGMNIDKLKESLNEIYEENFVEDTINLRLEDQKLAASIHSLADVLETKYDEDKISITFRTDKALAEKIYRLIGSGRN